MTHHERGRDDGEGGEVRAGPVEELQRDGAAVRVAAAGATEAPDLQHAVTAKTLSAPRMSRGLTLRPAARTICSDPLLLLASLVLPFWARWTCS